MGNILHDWNLENREMLIRKAYDALPEGGAFIAGTLGVESAEDQGATFVRMLPTAR